MNGQAQQSLTEQPAWERARLRDLIARDLNGQAMREADARMQARIEQDQGVKR